MLLHRINFWTLALPEVPGPLLAQAETIYEKSMDAAAKFGNGSDGMRFGMTLVALLVVIGVLAYLYVAGQRSTIDKLEKRITGLEKELHDTWQRHENEKDEQRADFDRRVAGFWGMTDLAVRELAVNNRWLQGQGLVPPQHSTPPVTMPPPPSPPSERKPTVQFMPSFPAGPRRIRARPNGGPREDRNDEQE